MKVKHFTYIHICRESVSRFLRGTVLNTLKQSGINILRGKKDATTFSQQACFVNRFTLLYVFQSLLFTCTLRIFHVIQLIFCSILRRETLGSMVLDNFFAICGNFNLEFRFSSSFLLFKSIMDGIKNYPSSPPPFSKPFLVSNCFVNRLKNNFEQLDSCLIHS